MMEYVRYYPLVAMGGDATDLQPMTPTDRESTVREHHRLWLSEIVPDYYRLGASDKSSVAGAFRVHCPKCGGYLKAITRPTKDSPLPVYACGKCSPLR